MAVRDVMDRILTLVRARYPLLQLVTHEEERVEIALDRLGVAESRPIFKWRATDGLSGPDGAFEGTTDPVAAIAALRALEGTAFVILFDVAAWWIEPRLRRQLRDLAQGVGPKQQTVF